MRGPGGVGQVVLLAALALFSGLAAGHAGHAGPEGAQLETADGQPALWGTLQGPAAPGRIAAVPWTDDALAVDGSVAGYADPALPAPGLAAGFRANATHLAVAMEYGGRGWFLVGVDQSTASRALVMMTQQIVARHAAVAGYVDDAGQLTWCAGDMGVFYPDPGAPGAAGHGAMAGAEGEVQVYYPTAAGNCTRPPDVVVAATASGGVTRVEVAFPHAWLGTAPGELRHVLLAFEPARRFLPPRLTEEATRGDVNALLLRPADDPAAVRAILAAPPSWEGLAVLAAVPLGWVGVGRGLRAAARQAS